MVKDIVIVLATFITQKSKEWLTLIYFYKIGTILDNFLECYFKFSNIHLI